MIDEAMCCSEPALAFQFDDSLVLRHFASARTAPAPPVAEVDR
jgi:hypothetical protein